MADVRSLMGVRYDPARVGDLGAVVSPPYDVIPEAELEAYRERSANNVIRLIRPGADYASSGRLFAQWLAEGALTLDREAMYLHEVLYTAPENGARPATRRRRDLIARLRLEPYDARVVLPHEKTHAGPKEDRLALYRATGIAFEPLWFLYEGQQSLLPQLLEQRFADEPALTFEFPAGEQHRLWVVDQPDWHGEVRRAFEDKQLLIADGHHRYETALAYADEVGGGPDHPSRFALALLTDLADPGLLVLPTHRVLKAGVKVVGGEPADSLETTLGALHGRTAAGTYREGAYEVLPLEGSVAVRELHDQVLDNLLGKRAAEDFLLYTRDAREAVRWVDEGRGTAAFLLDKPELGAIFEQARSGVPMPQKSTYFHPKPPSGMVFYRLAEKGKL